VTIQTVSLAADALMLLTAAAVIVLVVAAVVNVTRRRPRSAAGLAGAAGVVVLVYGGLLLFAGLASRPQQLGPGDAKCFDDWCAVMTGTRQDPATGALLVDVQLQNRARRQAMRANLARAYLEVPGRQEVAPEDGRGLHAMLQPGQLADVELTFAAPDSLRGVRFVVVEGAGSLGPGTFEIAGEGSPFHARAGWPLPAS
jgi:hypothetical protein